VSAVSISSPNSLPSLPSTDPLERLGDLARTDRAALAAIARSQGLDAEEALEAVQDALATMLAREREALTGDPERASATLRTIVRNAARNRRRLHRRARPHLPIETCCDRGPSPAEGEALRGEDDPSAEEALAHAEDLVRLRACVAELCSMQRAVVTLRLLDERSGEDVANALGLSRGYVDVIVHRAKDALRACMRS
jgi:RNA polymerase sigma-70 factor (ECF subfamily)